VRNDARRKVYEFEVLFDAQSCYWQPTVAIMMLVSPHGTDFQVTCIHTLESNSGILIAELHMLIEYLWFSRR
jgi:hypothetical protein